MIKYLEAHQGSTKYMVAAVGSNTAGAIALQSGRNVIDMGGFMGADPAPSLAQVEHLVDTQPAALHPARRSRAADPAAAGPRGGLGGGGPGGSGATGGLAWAVWPGGSGAKGGSDSGGTRWRHRSSNATVETRDRWIETHGTVVHVTGQSTTGSGATLYYSPAERRSHARAWTILTP